MELPEVERLIWLIERQFHKTRLTELVYLQLTSNQTELLLQYLHEIKDLLGD